MNENVDLMVGDSRDPPIILIPKGAHWRWREAAKSHVHDQGDSRSIGNRGLRGLMARNKTCILRDGSGSGFGSGVLMRLKICVSYV